MDIRIKRVYDPLPQTSRTRRRCKRITNSLQEIQQTHTLVLIPVYYTLYKRWEQWQESRRDRGSGLSVQQNSE